MLFPVCFHAVFSVQHIPGPSAPGIKYALRVEIPSLVSVPVFAVGKDPDLVICIYNFSELVYTTLGGI